MTQTISRIYANRENAAAAVKELKRHDFADGAITMVTPPDHDPSGPEPAGIPDDRLLASIARGGVTATHAAAYADLVRRGETLVSVRAPFGSAAKVASILQRFDPTETELGDQGYENPPPDPAAPFSSACGWRVLSDNPTPLSSLLGLPTLSTRQPSPKLIDDPAPFSKKINMQVLSDKPAILSARAGWRLLWDNPTPLSTRLGWPTLSKQQQPPDERFGSPLLSNDPAPLSSRLGWKLLSSNPAPLSTLLGWRVLSKDPSE